MGFVCVRSSTGWSFSPSCGGGNRGLRFMTDKEVHGVSDEAHSMSVFMEFQCDVRVASADRNDRMKHYRCESPTSVIRLHHHPLSLVFVLFDDYPKYGAEMEVRQHMARRERSDQELFGIVATCVAPEHWIRRSQEFWLLFGSDQVISSI